MGLSSPFGGDLGGGRPEKALLLSAFKRHNQPLESCAPPATRRGGRCPIGSGAARRASSGSLSWRSARETRELAGDSAA